MCHMAVARHCFKMQRYSRKEGERAQSYTRQNIMCNITVVYRDRLYVCIAEMQFYFKLLYPYSASIVCMSRLALPTGIM